MRYIGICLTVFAMSAAYGQSGDVPPAFEAASVKVTTPGGPIGARMSGGPGTNDPGRIDWVNIPLVTALMSAYDVRYYQLAAPDWVNSARFDITATIPKNATREQFHLMLQKLLADRFQLKLHHENRESTVYSLVVAKGGPKMKESPDESAITQAPPPGKRPKDEDGFPVFPARPGITQASDGPRIRWRAKQETMPQLSEWLTNYLGHPVTDATELTGKYDFVLTYANPGWGGRGAAATDTGESDSTPDLIGAMQQIGLQLEQRKGMVDTLVIDHMEKVPSEN